MLNVEISLRANLTVQVELVDTIKDKHILEREKMEACLEEQTQISEQSTELFVLKVENKRNVVLQNQLQMKVKHLEKQLNKNLKLTQTAGDDNTWQPKYSAM